MKTVYIPKGETVHYESLTTEHLVVHGRLHVTYGVKAQSITGSGVIDASSINADTVCIDDVESGTVICKRLIAKRVQAPEVFASESAAVSCFLSAAYVETGKLTAAISEVDEVVAQEVVNLTPKKRTLFGTLFASMLRSFWTALTAPGQKAEVLDAEFVPAQEDHTETVQNEGSAEFSASDQSVPEVEEKQEDVVDEELNRIVGLFKLSREQGYEDDILLLLRMIKFLHMQSPDAAHIFCQSHPVVDMEELLMVIDEVMWDIFDDVNFFFDEEYEATVVQCSHPIIDRLYERGRASDPKHGSRQSVWSKKLHDITEYFVLGATNSVYKFSQHIAGDHVVLEFCLSPDYYEPLYFANSLVDLLRYCQCSVRRIEAKLAERETENIRKEAA